MSKKLLLADDSVTIQRVIELTFSGEDIQVIPVGDGEAAIARIPIDKPDIVLADIGMPKRSGYEVCAFVKNHPDFKNTPVLLLAGAFEPVDDAKAKEVGCDGVLVKPFEPQHVIARVRELIGGATGSPTQSAVQDIPRPAARLAPPRPVELPKRADRPEMPDDLMDVVESDTAPRIEINEPYDAQATSTIILDDSLDDYFDKLDEAFGNVSGPAPSGTSSSSISTGAAPRAEARAPRPDRPVMERDLESFDEPMLIEDSAAQYSDAPRVADADPFAGMAELEPESGITVPTLDDLLGSMEGMEPAHEAAASTFPSTSPGASPSTPLGASEQPASTMIFDVPLVSSAVEGPDPMAAEDLVPHTAEGPVSTLLEERAAMVFDDTPVSMELEETPVSIDFEESSASSDVDMPASTMIFDQSHLVAPPVVVAAPPLEPPDVTASLTPAAAQPVASAPVAPIAAAAPVAPVAPVAPIAPVAPPSGRSIIADAFSALLAAEQGDSSASLVRLGGNGSNGSNAPVVTEAMVDDVARRVIEKLALGSSDQMNAIVKQIVSDVSERLVREEIERIRHK